MKGQAREHKSGRYSYAALDRRCDCGHPLGSHTAENPHECLVADCVCNRFKPKAARKHINK